MKNDMAGVRTLGAISNGEFYIIQNGECGFIHIEELCIENEDYYFFSLLSKMMGLPGRTMATSASPINCSVCDFLISFVFLISFQCYGTKSLPRATHSWPFRLYCQKLAQQV